MNTLLDDPGPKRLTRQPAERELFFKRLFEGFSEIHSSLESMKNTEVYLSRFPFPKTRISRPSYLKYHVENYLNEVYICEQRLLSYLTKIGREYRKDMRHAEVLAATRPLFRIVNDSLNGIVTTRGQHVHERRFSSVELDRLELMNLYTSINGEDMDEFTAALKPYFQSEYRRIRSEWQRRVRDNNGVLGKLLDEYAERLNPVLFSQDSGRLNYPSNLRST